MKPYVSETKNEYVQVWSEKALLTQCSSNSEECVYDGRTKIHTHS